MKKTNLLLGLAIMSLFSFQAFAGPSRGCPGRPCQPCRPYRPYRPCRPCPPPPCHRYYGCGSSSGVRLAADIVSLVGASLDIIRGPAVVPVAAAPAPVVQPVVQPVVPVPTSSPYYTPGYVRPCPVY